MRRDVPLPSFGGDRGWFPQESPHIAGVTPPHADGLAPSPGVPPVAFDLEGICLGGVLCLPQSLPRTLREKLRLGASSPSPPTLLGWTRGSAPQNPTCSDTKSGTLSGPPQDGARESPLPARGRGVLSKDLGMSRCPTLRRGYILEQNAIL